MYPRGEEAAARAAGEAGIICALSTLSVAVWKKLPQLPEGQFWYQLYLVGGRDCALAGIDPPKRLAFQPSLSQSTRRSPVSENATCVMA